MSGSKLFPILIAILPLVVPQFLQGEPRISSKEGILRVEIKGIGEKRGLIYVALWEDPETWLKEEPILGHEVKADRDKITFFIDGISPGWYALSVIHDLNENREFDSNFLGIPVEPFGFSNNVRNRFGPVSFSSARFEVGVDRVEQIIEVKPLAGVQDSESEG